ncbi:hypothetical protein TNCV_609591 [Trichonephila clavipes]|nr:hypothetical protein TNCV_609591 [Trichonephila clavipes]
MFQEFSNRQRTFPFHRSPNLKRKRSKEGARIGPPRSFQSDLHTNRPPELYLLVSGWPSGLRRQTQGCSLALMQSFECSGPRMWAWSECLNHMHKEEKSFVKEKKKERKLAASSQSKESDKKKKKQNNCANSSSAIAKSRSEYMREYQAE